AVDLDRVDLAAGIGQLVGLQQARGVEVAAPRRIGPAGDADPYGPAAGHRPAPQVSSRRTPGSTVPLRCRFRQDINAIRPAIPETRGTMDPGLRRDDDSSDIVIAASARSVDAAI